MNYIPLWETVDSMRHAANSIEKFVRSNEDGQPEKIEEEEDNAFIASKPAPQPTADCIAAVNPEAFGNARELADRMEAYRLALNACEDARSVLHEMADREGHSMTKRHARKCNVIAQRCTRAIVALIDAGEL